MNKNGWGLRVELGFLLLFVVCIIIATFGLHKMGLLGSKDDSYIDLSEYTKDTANFDYDALENRVSNAARKYYNDNYPNGSSDIVIVSVNTLKNNGYISSVLDSRNKECKGYSKIIQNSNVVSYLKCSIYVTSGYSEGYE